MSATGPGIATEEEGPPPSSTRGMIRSMLLIGGAQAIKILISILRMKLLALMTGPVGVGLLGIYSSLQSTAGTLAGLGLGSSGVRELAAARDDPQVLGRVRGVLFAANLAQGLIAMAVVWLLREPLARRLFGNDAHATATGLVGVAIVLSLVSSSQTALLQGLRRIGDLGRVTVISALAGTVVGLLAVWSQGEAGLIWFLIAQPATSVLVAWHYTRRLPASVRQTWTPHLMWQVWRPMVTLGLAFMLAGLAQAATLLLIRSLIARDLGLEAAGLFAAAWGISMTYIGFLLGAMGADYYPRLVEVIHRPEVAGRLMNDQMQIGLALGGPILLAMIGLAPWVMELLYSKAFTPAASMLQWQMLGNVLKLASWPLGFALVAAARSRTYLMTELGWSATFLVLVWLGLQHYGLEIAGAGFALAYLLYMTTCFLLVRRLNGFRPERLSLWLLITHSGLCTGLLLLAHLSSAVAALTGVPLALAAGLFGLRIVLIKVGPQGRLATRLTAFFAAIGWPVRGTP